MNNRIIAKILKEHIKVNKIKISDLVKRSGCSRANIYRILEGGNGTTVDTVLHLQRALGIQILIINPIYLT